MGVKKVKYIMLKLNTNTVIINKKVVVELLECNFPLSLYI